MSGSGPIYEYQRELTARLEQVMRERDEARAERDHFREQLRERAEALLDARAELERLELAALQELDEAQAALRTVAERQREACAVEARFYVGLGWTGEHVAQQVRATPLVTEGKP